jgi:hypothetical protein
VRTTHGEPGRVDPVIGDSNVPDLVAVALEVETDVQSGAELVKRLQEVPDLLPAFLLGGGAFCLCLLVRSSSHFGEEQRPVRPPGLSALLC